MTDKNTPFQAVVNKGWKFVHSNHSYAYRMYGFPTLRQFQQFLGRDYESLLIPIHYDMCVGTELVQAFLDADDKYLPGGNFLVGDCFHDLVNDVPDEFNLHRPIIKTAKEFLAFHK